MSRVAPWILLVTGALLLLSGLAHAFLGWPALAEELSSARVPADLATTVAVGWLYGSGAMLTFGAIVLMIGWSGHPSGVRATRLLVPISVLYLVFGVSALVYTAGSPHFIGFIVLGGLLAIAGYGLRTRRGVG